MKDICSLDENRGKGGPEQTRMVALGPQKRMQTLNFIKCKARTAS